MGHHVAASRIQLRGPARSAQQPSFVGSETSRRSGLEVRMTPTIGIEQSEWTLPDRGRVGVVCLIATEFALFTIFVVAYVFYMGKSLTGPTPSQVLELPVWPTVCLLSSSITVGLADRALKSDRLLGFKLWTGATILLGLEFLRQTAMEWRHLVA